MEARYLNVDLVIEHAGDISGLAEYLEGKVFFLWKEFKPDASSIGLESNLCDTTGPQQDIVEILTILETLPFEMGNLWAACNRKVFDIGYECGTMDEPINSLLDANTLKRIVNLGCEVNIRLYPPVEESQ